MHPEHVSDVYSLSLVFGREGQEIEFEPTGPIALHDRELTIEAALAGITLAYVWEDRARPYIESGRLVRCPEHVDCLRLPLAYSMRMRGS